MSLKIFEVQDTLLALFDTLDGATDADTAERITQEIDKAIEQHIAAVDNLNAWIDAMESDIARRRDAKKRLEDSILRAETRLDWVTRQVRDYLLQYGELRGDLTAIKLVRNPPSLEVRDDSVVPARFKTIVQTEKIDKAQIKRALQAGEEIPGATLATSYRLKRS
jgi:outer membrane murein-binding lipoprotein Lpp